MTLLEQQLAELQAKKNRVDEFKILIAKITDSPNTTTVSKEVIEFIEKRITAIESGSDVLGIDTPVATLSFTDDEVGVLKQMANKILTNKVSPPVPIQNPEIKDRTTHASGAFGDEETEELPPKRPNPKQPTQPPKRAANQDKISFAMAHRHLAEKRCTVVTATGNKVGGKIVGMDAPYLVVQTDTGHAINVPPEEVTVG